MTAQAEPSRRERFGRRLRVAMVGGGLDSVIGGPHRTAQRLAGLELVAGAFSIDRDVSKATGRHELIAADRAYDNFEEMLAGEVGRSDRPDLVVVATPPSSHAGLARAALDAGFDVLCEKPLTATVAEGREVAEAVAGSGRIFATGYYFSGYPIIRHAREIVRSGELGEVRMVEAVYAPGAPPVELDQPREQRHWRWREDDMGAAGILGEVGTHAQQMLESVTGRRVSAVSAQLGRIEARREVYDNAYLTIRLGDAVGRIWDSYAGLGNEHGFSFQIYGSEASIRWEQEHPEHLDLRTWDGGRRRLSRGASYLSEGAQRSSVLPLGHPEGWLFAVANVYRELGEAILARELDEGPEAIERAMSFVPGIEDGLAGNRLIEAAVRSNDDDGSWVKV